MAQRHPFGLSKLFVSLFVLGVGLFPVAAGAQVRDYAEIFSPEAERQAQQTIQELKKKFSRGMLVETYASVPAEKTAELQQKGRERFVADFAGERGRAEGIDGIVFVIFMDVGRFDVVIGDVTKREGLFTDKDRQDMRGGITESLKAKKYDDVLTRTATFALNRMSEHRPQGAAAGATAGGAGVVAGGSSSAGRPAAPANVPAPSSVPPAASNPPAGDSGRSFSISTLLCMGIAIFALFMIIRGIIRGRQQAAAYRQGPQGGPGYGGHQGYGQPGYGQPGYGQPGYGGGGSGFGTGLLGGVLGGMAGGWLGNKVFGQTPPPPTDSGAAFGSTPPGDSSIPHDTGFDSGGGGDFGSSSSGGYDSGGDSGGSFDSGGDSGGGFDGGGGGDF